MLRELKATSPKLVAVCFDVSGSMENLGVFGPLREALVPLLRDGLKPGDQCLITAFDPSAQVLFDQKIKDDADIEAAVDALPGSTTPDRMGTNIRRPHHDALRAGEARKLRRSFLILVSDSYNDTPQQTDAAWSEYTRYYSLDQKGVGRLDVYPTTRENSDYERLLRRASSLGITTWGIGVEIDARTGRPKERLPRTPEMKPEPERTAPAPAGSSAPKDSEIPWLWILLGLAAAGLVIGYASLTRPVDVSLAESPRRYQNYKLRPRDVITIGGLGARSDDRSYPIPGPREPSAYLERGLRDFTLRPGEAAKGGQSTVFVNNQEVSQPRRIVFSDDIKVKTAPAGETGAVSTEHRLHFGRAVEELAG